MQPEVFRNYKELFSVGAEDVQVQNFGKSPDIVLGNQKRCNKAGAQIESKSSYSSMFVSEGE